MPFSMFKRLTPLSLRVRLFIGRMLFQSLGRGVVRVSPHRIIKGPCQVPELEALRFVAEHTSIPVPQVYRTYHDGEHLYIEMAYVKGTTLENAWRGRGDGGLLSPTQKKSFVQELAHYVSQLRELEPPRDGIVASSDGANGVLDYRIGYALAGPYQTHEELHSFLRGNLALEKCAQVFDESVLRCHSRHYRSCFSHADLAPRNVMVRGGKIVAIIDWAFAGWYPEYWEYTKAHYGLFSLPDWYEEFSSAVTRYEDELAAERVLWTKYDEPGTAHTWFNWRDVERADVPSAEIN